MEVVHRWTILSAVEKGGDGILQSTGVLMG